MLLQPSWEAWMVAMIVSAKAGSTDEHTALIGTGRTSAVRSPGMVPRYGTLGPWTMVMSLR